MTSGDERRTTMQGYVYVQTNDSDANEVVVYRHDDEGRLGRLGSYLTGGKGSGTAHLPSQSSVALHGDNLFVTNAGSNELTVFAVADGSLAAIDVVPSGGEAPRSVAVHEQHVYVLNTAGSPNVNGFRFDGER